VFNEDGYSIFTFFLSLQREDWVTQGQLQWNVDPFFPWKIPIRILTEKKKKKKITVERKKMVKYIFFLVLYYNMKLVFTLFQILHKIISLYQFIENIYNKYQSEIKITINLSEIKITILSYRQ